ncbi:MAG: pirin family protein [Bacteroidales bacterium]|nr:pirin family protein [Bacteroidales bacterium]MCF8404313.1 pirin family protein [Bacteroidales bacterium]
MKNRRSFIKKIIAVSSSTALGGLKGISSTKINGMNTPEVKNIKPLGFQWETSDPFLFCVHHEDFFPKGNANMGPDPGHLKGRQIGQDFLIKDGWRMYHGQKVPGFPSHPHRGFETVTVVRKGMVDHSDSLGASGRYGHGDTQWMTAGKGIQHAEMFPLINQDKENPLELFQIWLNLPKAKKFVEPHFKMLWADSIPVFDLTDENGKQTKVEIIAGTLGQYSAPPPPPDSWAADSTNEVGIWNAKMEAWAHWTLPEASEGIIRTIYFYKGNKLKIGDAELDNYHSAEIPADMEIIIESGDEDSHILILQGKPIAEPVVQHGPFVMNTRQEIQQAFDDYQRTEFGGWPWPVSGPVHPIDQGRFAKHADGRIENK